MRASSLAHLLMACDGEHVLRFNQGVHLTVRCPAAGVAPAGWRDRHWWQVLMWLQGTATRKSAGARAVKSVQQL
jgi:hypothetical protein